MHFATYACRPERPDRYIDWQYRAAHRDDTAERWCVALVAVKERDLNNNLQGLRDKALSHDFPLRMLCSERERLQALIDCGPHEVDETASRFFVYLPETQVYWDGGYKLHSNFDIVFAGQSIEGFSAGSLSRPPASAGTGSDETDGLVANSDDSPRCPKRSRVAAKAVAIGVIDDGLAFAHERFCRRDKSTRLQGLWLQAYETAQGPVDVNAGVLYQGARLDELDALRREMRDVELYRHPSVDQLNFSSPIHKPLAYRRAHGTHVMDLACGYDAVTEDRADRPILAVQLPSDVTADTSGQKLAPYFLQALRLIMQWADDLEERLPLVINFSYGFAAGPKDGTHIIEREIDALVRARNQRGAPTIVVLPAGNNFESRTTALVSLKGGQTQELTWIIPPDDETDNYLEIYVEAPGNIGAAAPAVDLKLTPPNGIPILHAPRSGGKLQVLCDGERPIAGIYFDRMMAVDGMNRQRFFIAVNRTLDRRGKARPAASGRWRLAVTGKGEETTRVRLFIQRDDTPSGYRRRGRQSYFDHPAAYQRDPATGSYDQLGATNGEALGPITHSGTLSAIANGETPIVVGAAVGVDSFTPAAYTSSGPTETREGPDISAVVDQSPALKGVMAAGTLSGSVVTMSGTSAAAPQVTRLIADRLACERDRCYSAGVFDPGKLLVDLPCEVVAFDHQHPQLGGMVVQRKRPDHIPRRKYPSTS